MNLLHEKSTCCNAKIIRFGGKRRQCSVCKKTWRVYQSKRGRKNSRHQQNYLKKVFCQNFSIKQLSFNSTLPLDSIYKRFSKNLNNVINKKRVVRIRGEKLILIIDAQWHYFKKDLWTIYFVAVKSTKSNFVTVLDPVLKQGKENAKTWNEIFNHLPVSTRKRVIALVSDGIRGIETIASNNKWILQRCLFHLLSTLQKMRGKRASTYGRLIREKIYCLIESIVYEKSKWKVKIFCRKLSLLIENDQIPKRMKMVAREFLRRLPEFRNHIEHQDLSLPNTVNVMESINSFSRRKAKTTCTPKSWHKWVLACIRFKSIFNCK